MPSKVFHVQGSNHLYELFFSLTPKCLTLHIQILGRRSTSASNFSHVRKKIMDGIWVRSQIFDSRKLYHNILSGWQMNCSQKFGIFWWNLDEVRHPQSWRVTWGHLGIFSLWLGVSNMCIKKIPNPFSQVMHNHHLVLRGGGDPTQIGHHIWNI